jgi:hypothetical protein
MVLAFDVPTDNRKAVEKLSLEALLEAKCNSDFATFFCGAAGSAEHHGSTSDYWAATRAAMGKASVVLPPAPEKANNPWISPHTRLSFATAVGKIPK